MAQETSAPVKEATQAIQKLTVSPFPLEFTPVPEYVQYRIQMFDRLKARRLEELAAREKSSINITLPDGRNMEGRAWETTPMDIAKLISSSLADRLVIARVKHVGKEPTLYDTLRPLEGDCQLELLDFENDEAKQVFWHSSAHVLGEACEKHYACHLCLGPPLETGGFYYEMAIKDRVVTPLDYPHLNQLAKNVIKEKQTFERLEMTKEELLEMFQHNPYKLHFIRDKVPDGTSSTVYRCGPLIDLCLGPHIPHTGRIKAFEVTKNSSSYFLGNAENDALQRVYGMSFPDAKMMKEWQKEREEAQKRDHRKLGQDQHLFFFHEWSPGSCFFLPHGARIYNRLVEFIRSEYRQRGFEEVITPNVFNTKLWERSGHWQNYQENMFSFDVEKEQYALKPMNCPGHCLIFAHKERSYRELPLRLADFGVLHRNELSGTLSGLTRVRRFQQDDAHIFCTRDQLGSEMSSCLAFMRHVYGIFGFTFSLKLSTRPEKYLGALETWNDAEAQLKRSLDEFGEPWEYNHGDGAFYGPKIDITIQDAHKRRHQCATIQLDFQLPERFKLRYTASSSQASEEAPVIIHRAILGSVERMMAILTENYAGQWPLWLSPRQLMVIPVSRANDGYAKECQVMFHDAGFYADVDLDTSTLPKKVRQAELARYNFIAVVGQQEEQSQSINLRQVTADKKDLVLPLKEALIALQRVRDSKSPLNIVNNGVESK